MASQHSAQASCLAYLRLKQRCGFVPKSRNLMHSLHQKPRQRPSEASTETMTTPVALQPQNDAHTSLPRQGKPDMTMKVSISKEPTGMENFICHRQMSVDMENQVELDVGSAGIGQGLISHAAGHSQPKHAGLLGMSADTGLSSLDTVSLLPSVPMSVPDTFSITSGHGEKSLWDFHKLPLQSSLGEESILTAGFTQGYPIHSSSTLTERGPFDSLVTQLACAGGTVPRVDTDMTFDINGDFSPTLQAEPQLPPTEQYRSNPSYDLAQNLIDPTTSWPSADCD